LVDLAHIHRAIPQTLLSFGLVLFWTSIPRNSLLRILSRLVVSLYQGRYLVCLHHSTPPVVPASPIRYLFEADLCQRALLVVRVLGEVLPARSMGHGSRHPANRGILNTSTDPFKARGLKWPEAGRRGGDLSRRYPARGFPSPNTLPEPPRIPFSMYYVPKI